MSSPSSIPPRSDHRLHGRSPRGLALVLLGLLGLTFGAWQLLRPRLSPSGEPAPAAPPPPAAVRPAPATAPAPARPVATEEAGSAPTGRHPLAAQLEALAARLGQKSLAPDSVAAALGELARHVRAWPRAEAVPALDAWLRQGHDAATGLPFAVGPGGDLRTAPTLRTWALDLLGQIDAAAAAAFSPLIYARFDSPDEWALALRNDWRARAPAGQIADVRARVATLLTQAAWAAQPSPGFLEALDLVVATLAWEQVPRLEAWLDTTQPVALRHAAAVALDRLTMEAPQDVLAQLAQHPDWLARQPALRAGLMARADLAAGEQRAAVEKYLAQPVLSEAEGERFLALVPNVNATLSYNLVTTARAPSREQAARLDLATLDVVRAWQTQPAYARWRPALERAEARLVESVAAARRGGYLPR